MSTHWTYIQATFTLAASSQLKPRYVYTQHPFFVKTFGAINLVFVLTRSDSPAIDTSPQPDCQTGYEDSLEPSPQFILSFLPNDMKTHGQFCLSPIVNGPIEFDFKTTLVFLGIFVAVRQCCLLPFTNLTDRFEVAH